MIPKIYHFQRLKKPKRLFLKRQDYKILDLIDRYRFLDSEMLYKLLPLDFPDYSQDAIKHRLHRLWLAGYLERPAEQIVLAVRNEQRYLIYCLSKEGSDLLREKLGKPKVRWKEKQEKASYKMIEHTLEIARFRLAIELTKKFEIPFWLGDKEFAKRVTFPINNRVQEELVRRYKRGIGEEISLVIQPDSFFCLKGDSLKFYALEWDRGTLQLERVLLKFLIYYKILKHLKETGETIPVEGYQIRDFRLLVVCPNQPRLRHLLEGAKAVDEKGIGYGGFWFTLRDQFSFREPESILRKIWLNPRGQRFSLLE